MSDTPPVILSVPESVLKWDVISIAVSIGRGIFQKYFTPTAFRKFDRDYELTQLVIELFRDQPEAIQLLEEKWPDLEQKINKRNVVAILRWDARVDFKWFIREELGWEQSQAFQVFQLFLERMEKYEDEEKNKVLELIDEWRLLSEEDYTFILELFAYDRCQYKDFQKFYKFIRNTQFEEHLIIASIRTMREQRFKEWFTKLIKEKWSPQAKEIVWKFQ